MIKFKPCDGTGIAKGYGCGKMVAVENRKYGLGKMCCYGEWLFNSDAGKVKMSKAISQAKAYVKAKEKEKTKQAKDKLKTLSQYEVDAKRSFQKYIRLRDADLPCISCGENNKDLWDGGHYKKAEIYSGLIFDEMNCHKQCRKCNRYLGGNELNYRSGLIIRFGEESVLEVEKRALASRMYKYTKDELIEIKKKYDQKIKEMHHESRR